LSTPRGLSGDQWGDPRVVGAAEIAEALGDRWKTCGFHQIEPALAASKRIEDTIYKLRTRGRCTVIWGRAPGMDVPGEPTTAQKLAFLDKEMENYGTLEAPKGFRRDINLPFLIQ
jgi:hypothetical protein